MCLIIDTCALGDFLNKSNPNVTMIIEWLYSYRGRLLYSQHLIREAKFGERYMQFINELRRADLTVKSEIGHAEVEKYAAICKSNDHQLIAAIVKYGVNVIFTYDKDLISDFLNEDLVGKHKRVVIGKELIDKYELNTTYCPRQDYLL